MTTIAWDGVTLAADKRCSVGNQRMTVTKIRRGKSGNLVGCAGGMALFEDIFAWLCDGGKRPEAQGEKGEWCEVLEVMPDGRIYRHERLGRFLIEDKQYAIGSGGSYARTAMACGKNAEEAIKVASLFDPASGDGVDALPLKVKPAQRRRVR